MRPFEIALAIALAVRFVTHHRYRLVEYFPILVALSQIVFEGYRWQLVPLYILTIFVGILSVRRLDPWLEKSERFKPWVSSLGWFILLSVTLTSPILFPIPHPRGPDGPFTVGTMSWFLVDESRTDPYAPEPDTPRRLMVQAWYPAKYDPDLEIAGWMPHAEVVARAISSWLEMPSFFLDQLVYAKSDSLQNAAIMDGGPYPVVIFSHGWGGFRAQNTSQAQLLASHGFIVIAIEHTYSAVITVFPDGERAYHNSMALPEGVSDAKFREAAEKLMTQWTGDFDFLLKTMAEWKTQDDHPLFNALDLDRVGLMGHSTGGRAVLQFCSQELRCKAGLVMDPWLMDEEVPAFQVGPSQPFLFMFSEDWSSGPESDRFQAYARHLSGNPIIFRIQGSEHLDFTDLAALSPLSASLGLKGPIAGDKMLEIVFYYTSLFFEEELEDIQTPELGASNPVFPEVNFFDP